MVFIIIHANINLCRVVLCNLQFSSIPVNILLLSIHKVCTGMGIGIGNKLYCYLPTKVGVIVLNKSGC